MAEGMQATQRVDHRLVAVGEDDSARADRRADGAGADDAIADRAGGVVTAARGHDQAGRQSGHARGGSRDRAGDVGPFVHSG